MLKQWFYCPTGHSPLGNSAIPHRLRTTALWRRGRTYKLLRLPPDRYMVRKIMKMVNNRSFTHTTGNGKRSRLRRFKNSVPQGVVLALFFFNIYIYDLPTTISRNYAYTNNLVIIHADRDWKVVERALSKDMEL